MINKDNAAQYLPLVQALAEGKTLQYLNIQEKWVDMFDVSFSGRVENYRIKPEPREIEVWARPDNMYAWIAHSGEDNTYLEAAGYTKVRFKEVL